MQLLKLAETFADKANLNAALENFKLVVSHQVFPYQALRNFALHHLSLAVKTFFLKAVPLPHFLLRPQVLVD